MIFVEVKTRSNLGFKRLEDAVSTAKQGLLTNAASVYMEQVGHEWEIRFDIITILYSSQTAYDLQHLPDAFFPGW